MISRFLIRKERAYDRDLKSLFVFEVKDIELLVEKK